MFVREHRVTQEPVWLRELADWAIIFNAGLGLAGFAFGYFVRGLKEKGDDE